MKFIFDRDEMIKEIAIAQEIIAIKNALSILSNVLLTAENDTLTIRATDTKVSFQTKIPVNVEEEGTTTIFCDKFMSILNKTAHEKSKISDKKYVQRQFSCIQYNRRHSVF